MNVGAIITATVVVGCGGWPLYRNFLGVAGKTFVVERRMNGRLRFGRRWAQLRRLGGYPGCDGSAAAIAKGEAPALSGGRRACGKRS